MNTCFPFSRPYGYLEVEKDYEVFLLKNHCHPVLFSRRHGYRLNTFPITCAYPNSQILKGPDSGFLILDKTSRLILWSNFNGNTVQIARTQWRVRQLYFEKDEGLLYVAYDTGEIYEYKFINQNSRLNSGVRMWKTESQQISGLYIRNGKIFYSDEGAGIVNGFDMEKKSITNFCQEGIEGYGKSRRPGEVLATNDLLIVNDRDNYLIQFFDIKGEFLYQIGGKGSGICCFDLVEGIQLEGDVLLIADMNNDRILRYSLINLEMEVTHRRRYIPGLLCRPVSGCLVGDKIFVADRSNAVIPIIDPLKGFQGVFPMKKPRVDLGSPTGLVAISSRNLLFVLFRGNDYGRGTLCLFDLHTGNCISYDRERIADAQGMTYGNQQVVVCDGKGKSGFIYSESLKLIKRLDFLKDSQNSRFLCRMPSYAFGKFYFPDYHSNQVLVYDMEWNLLQVLLVNLSQYGIKHIRKVFPFSNGFVLLGGKKPWGVEVDTEWNLKKISRLPLMFFKNTFSSPSDMIWLEEKKVIVFDKEQDRLVKLTDETMDLVGNVSAGSAG